MKRRRAWIGLLLIAVLAWLGIRWARRADSPAPSAGAPADTATAGFRAVTLWFADDSGDSLVSESREIIEQSDLHERVATLVDELARGPSSRGVAVVPTGTRLLHVYLNERGLLTLDLSGAFRSGFQGGSSAEALAVASLVRTIAASLPEMKQLLVVCEGAPIGSIGGHVPLDRPVDVADWP
jgi:spore germination protein GerM